MSLVIGLLTFVLVVNCLLLMLLVLIQLPKKEAGAGLAFGGGATDALFGAGSGTALTKVTRYMATTFLGLALVLAMLNSRVHNTSLGIEEELTRSSTAAAPASATTPATATQPQELTTPQQPLANQPQPLQLTTPVSNAPAAGTFEPLQLQTAPAEGTETAPTEAPAKAAAENEAPPANPAPAPEQ